MATARTRHAASAAGSTTRRRAAARARGVRAAQRAVGRAGCRTARDEPRRRTLHLCCGCTLGADRGEDRAAPRGEERVVGQRGLVLAQRRRDQRDGAAAVAAQCGHASAWAAAQASSPGVSASVGSARCAGAPAASSIRASRRSRRAQSSAGYSTTSLLSPVADASSRAAPRRAASGRHEKN